MKRGIHSSVKGFSYYIEDEILEEYRKKPLKMRLLWLYAGNKLRSKYPKEIIERHNKFRCEIHHGKRGNKRFNGFKKGVRYEKS